jgi:4-hydroxy-2-oxoheptanedioate aldolase
MFSNQLKQQLQAGKSAVGMFITSTDPSLTEIAGIAGFDFVVIDTEHGPLQPMDVMNHVRAAEAKGITPICRSTNGETTTILRILDVGAHGVQVPQVNSAAEAAQAVAAAKYYPEGSRGMAIPRALDFGLNDLMGSFTRSNREALIVVHCETAASLNSIEEIAGVDGVDIIFLGPFDLSQSLGIPGQVNHPSIQKAAKTILTACERNGKAAGIFASDGVQAKQRMEEGFQYVTINMDLTLYGLKCREELQKCRV